MVSLCENPFLSLSLLPQEYTLKFSMWRGILKDLDWSVWEVVLVFLLFSHSVVCDSSWHWLQHARLFCLSVSPRVCSNSCPLKLAEPSNHLILCYPLFLLPSIFPSIRVFSNESVFTSGGWSIGASASASVLPINIQGWFPLGLTGLNSLLPKGLARIFSSTTVQKHQFFGVQPSLVSNSDICKWLLEKKNSFNYTTFVSKVMSLLLNMLSRFVLAFLPRIKHLLISWL